MSGQPLEVLRRPLQTGPRLTQNEAEHLWAGRTLVASGSVSATVSTALVNSDSIILLATEVASAGVGANSGGGIAVNSIVSGTSFALTNRTGVAVAFDQTVMWELIRRS